MSTLDTKPDLSIGVNVSSVDKNKQWQRELLMERLRTRASQHKTFPELSKMMRMSMLEKRYALDAVEKANLQKCLDSMQHCIKVTTRQGLVERLESLSRQLGLKFMQDSATLFIASDMFYLEIILDQNGALSDVKVHHECKIEQQSCSELVSCLMNGDFSDFTAQLEGLSCIYQLNAEAKVKSKAFVALQAMETDLYNLFAVQNLHKDIQRLQVESVVGIAHKRRGGHAMKLTYFIPPYDLLNLESKSMIPLTLETLTASKSIGMHVTVNLEASSGNKLQILPTVSFNQDAQGNSVPSYAPLTPANSILLPATFVLRLNRPVAICESFLQGITTNENEISESKAPIMQLIVQIASGGKLTNLSKGLFVTLPDQNHCYFFTENKQMKAYKIASIPFTEPSQVPKILSVFRCHGRFYTLLASCVRLQGKCRDLESMTMVEVNAISVYQIAVTLEHPYEESMATVEFNLSDPFTVSCRLCPVSANSEIISAKLSKIAQKCLSIPVTIRALIKYWEEEKLDSLHRGIDNANFNLPLGPNDPGNKTNDPKIKTERNNVNGNFSNSYGRQFFHSSGVMLNLQNSSLNVNNEIKTDPFEMCLASMQDDPLNFDLDKERFPTSNLTGFLINEKGKKIKAEKSNLIEKAKVKRKVSSPSDDKLKRKLDGLNSPKKIKKHSFRGDISTETQHLKGFTAGEFIELNNSIMGKSNTLTIKNVPNSKSKSSSKTVVPRGKGKDHNMKTALKKTGNAKQMDLSVEILQNHCSSDQPLTKVKGSPMNTESLKRLSTLYNNANNSSTSKTNNIYKIPKSCIKAVINKFKTAKEGETISQIGEILVSKISDKKRGDSLVTSKSNSSVENKITISTIPNEKSSSSDGFNEPFNNLKVKISKTGCEEITIKTSSMKDIIKPANSSYSPLPSPSSLTKSELDSKNLSVASTSLNHGNKKRTMSTSSQQGTSKLTMKKSYSSSNLSGTKKGSSRSLSKSLSAYSLENNNTSEQGKSGKSNPPDVMQILRMTYSKDLAEKFMKSLNTKFQIPKLSARSSNETTKSTTATQVKNETSPEKKDSSDGQSSNSSTTSGSSSSTKLNSNVENLVTAPLKENPESFSNTAISLAPEMNKLPSTSGHNNLINATSEPEKNLILPIIDSSGNSSMENMKQNSFIGKETISKYHTNSDDNSGDKIPMHINGETPPCNLQFQDRRFNTFLCGITTIKNSSSNSPLMIGHSITPMSSPLNEDDRIDEGLIQVASK